MKTRTLFLLALLALTARLGMAQATSWAADPAHSEVGFTVRYMGLNNVHGRFGPVTGQLVYNQADPSKSTVNVVIDLAALDTGVASRDNHLKTPDFFDTTHYATANFTSTSVTRNGAGLKVLGNLALHGVVKPVELDVEGPAAPVQSPDGKTRTGFSATAVVSRSAFNIGPKYPSALISDEVKLAIDLLVIRQ